MREEGRGELVGLHSCAAVEAGAGRGGGGQSRIIIALQGTMNGLLFGLLLCLRLFATTSATLEATEEKHVNIKREIYNLHMNVIRPPLFPQNQSLSQGPREKDDGVSGGEGS